MLACEYPPVEGVAEAQDAARFLLQPSSTLCPRGVTPSSDDINMFGIFHTMSVKMASGPFNKTFWDIEVPRAAQTYPAMWHAGIALAAIYQSARQDTTWKLDLQTKRTSMPIPQNHQYRMALKHFNKSIRYVTETIVSSKVRPLTWAEQEMAIMTNILYVGVAGMLEDSPQMDEHIVNLLKLLEGLRFGENPGMAKGGMLSHDALLSIVLPLDASWDNDNLFPSRRMRDWVVPVPTYGSFSSVTEAYLAFLPFYRRQLVPKAFYDEVPDQHGPSSYEGTMLPRLKEFERNLAEFGSSGLVVSHYDRQAVQTMQLHAKSIRLRFQIKMQTRREDYIKLDTKFAPLLEEVDELLSQGLVAGKESGPPPVVFAPTAWSILNFIGGMSYNVAIQRRAIELLRKWPFKESGEESEESAHSLEALIKFRLGGPSRTREHQLAGFPILPTFANGGLIYREFDGTRECECLPGHFVCRDHSLRWYDRGPGIEPQRIFMRCWYEVRHDLPGVTYLFYGDEQAGQTGHV